MHTAQVEQAKYNKAWALPAYHNDSPGETYGEMFHSIVRDPGAFVLDVGAGAGKGSRFLKDLGYDVTACDLTDAGWDHSSEIPFFTANIWDTNWFRGCYDEKFDYVYCCDMMEHLPIQFVSLAVRNMLATVRKGVFLSVCFREDNMGKIIGEHLHLTVQPYRWWLQFFRDMGHVAEARDLIGDGIFFVRPA